MLFEEALVKYLSTYGDLTEYIDDKIFPLVVPDGISSPAITYQQISGKNIEALSSSPGSGFYNYQIKIFASTYATAKEIAKEIQTALKDYKGIMGGTGGVNIGATLKNSDDIDDYDEEMKEYSVLQEYSFFFKKV